MNAMTAVDLVRGLTRVAVATGRQLSDMELEVYAEALGPQTNAGEWERFTRAVVASGRWRWWPTVAEVLDALREFRGAKPIDAEAGAAYEAVLGARTYHPEAGATWSYRTVLVRCGKAAAEAFLAAGGPEAFRTEWQADKRRAAFLAAYQREAREMPEGRLLPAGPEVPQLPAGEPDRVVPLAETAALMRRVAEEAEKAHGGPLPGIGGRMARVVQVDEQTVARLRKQAAEIAG